MLKAIAVGLSFILFIKAQTMLVGESNLTPVLESIALIIIGPLLSILLAHPWQSIQKLLRETVGKEGREPGRREGLIDQIQRLARVWQADGPKALEKANQEISHPLLRKGVDMVIDGYSSEETRRILEKNFEIYLSGKNAQAAILSSLVKLTQSFGFIGTVIGLINVLNNLGNGGAQIGPGVSVALFTTLYGLLFANFLYIPAHKKYIEKIRGECNLFPIIAEGVGSMANRESARHIYYKLSCCFDHQEPGMESLTELEMEPLPGTPIDEQLFPAV